MFKDCIVFDEIKRQEQTIPDRNIHTEDEYIMQQEQLDYVNMLKEMREIRYNPKFYQLLKKRFVSTLGKEFCDEIR